MSPSSRAIVRLVVPAVLIVAACSGSNSDDSGSDAGAGPDASGSDGAAPLDGSHNNTDAASNADDGGNASDTGAPGDAGDSGSVTDAGTDAGADASFDASLGCSPNCAAGAACAADGDCAKPLACSVAGLCATGATDGKQDFGESAIDCGGNTTDMAPTCADGETCALDNDCASAWCSVGKLCVATSYVDGKQDNGETDVDCGGPNGAPACANGKMCVAPTDCVVGSICDTPNVCATCGSLSIPVGGGAVVNASAAIMPTGNACYEAWLNLDNTKSSPAFLTDCSAGDVCDFILSVRDDLGKVLFAAQNGGALLSASYGFNPHDGAWHHVAGCRAVAGANVTLTLFWDGQLKSTVVGTTAQVGAPTDLRLGSISYATTDGLGGLIDEVRVSSTLRYAANFVPTNRFANDASTSVLLHFDSANGATFSDSSSHALSGSMLGATTLTATCH